MEKKEFKKYFKNEIDKLILTFKSENILLNYSDNAICVKLLDNSVGQIEIKFLTGKQLPTGALASVFVSANIAGGEIWEKIKENVNLKKKNTDPYTDYLFCFYSSSTKNPLFKNTRTDFFQSDNIEEKVKQFLNFISNEVLQKIFNILLLTSDSIEDILNTPNFYGQPELSILFICKKKLEIEKLSVIENDKRFSNSSEINKKLWDANKKILFH